MEIFLQFLHMKDCQAPRQASSPTGKTCIKNFIYLYGAIFIYLDRIRTQLNPVQIRIWIQNTAGIYDYWKMRNSKQPTDDWVAFVQWSVLLLSIKVCIFVIFSCFCPVTLLLVLWRRHIRHNQTVRQAVEYCTCTYISVVWRDDRWNKGMHTDE